ncbi:MULTISPECIES: staygreen family protein [Priestia]|uniref:staygreen family protein n=1 Tax=Priestia TaxID=2800373 RepID=UPI0013D21C54|nr:staygreen family protein [Priestia flexa]MBY6086778.1 staygreen family protein [Priestia flexa]
MIIASPRQVDVTYGLGITSTEPMIPRKYTIFPSHQSSIPSIYVGLEFAYDHISKSRNECLASFLFNKGFYSLSLYFYIDHTISEDAALERYIHLLEILPVYLNTLYHSEKLFFQKHPLLEHCPIFLYTDSSHSFLDGKKSLGALYQYR